MDKKLFTRFAIREIMGVAVVAAALFIPAGRWDWVQAWAVVLVMLAWVIATAWVILRIHPALFAERMGPKKGAKGWDTFIMSLVGLAQLARYILAGLDQRYSWTADWIGNFPLGWQLLALLGCLLGQALVVWATASNAYFSQIVRVQSERAHTVASGGPYRWVRHPGYAGSILFELALPFLLASWPAMLLSLLDIGLFVLRTFLEDRMLLQELDGYADYAANVRYRLLPGIW